MSSSGATDGVSDSEAASVGSLKPIWPWIEGICTVLFDIDVGQTVRDIVPGRVLTEEEESAVAFNSFPVSQAALVCLIDVLQLVQLVPCLPQDSMSMELSLRNSIRDRYVIMLCVMCDLFTLSKCFIAVQLILLSNQALSSCSRFCFCQGR